MTIARSTWRRVVDVNDRFLREIQVGLGKEEAGFEHRSGYDITVASEIMAILALTTSRSDMRERLGSMVIGTDRSGTRQPEAPTTHTCPAPIPRLPPA